MVYLVSYRPRNGGEVQVANVDVREQGDGRFYATNLSLWGCGRSAATERGAIVALVQDMAQIVKIDAE